MAVFQLTPRRSPPDAASGQPDAPSATRDAGRSARAQSAELHQLMARPGGAPDDQAVQQRASAGLAGAGGALPHMDRIQQSFGRHRMDGVQAFMGGQAAAATRAIGAQAYTSGERIAFGAAPDLFTAAHEAAHVVQQRAGVQLPGGVGRTGDRYERHADQVAAAVVAGRSAEGLLDKSPGSAQAAASHGPAALQRKEAAKGGGNEQGDSPVPAGHELYVARSLLGMTYHHASVYIGNNQVMHVFAEPAQALRDMVVGNPIVKVRRSSLATFASGDPVTPGPTPTTREPIEAAVMASAREGETWHYDPLNNNCQHFSSQMVSGTRDSPEADAIKSTFARVIEHLVHTASVPVEAIKSAAGWIKKTGAKLGKKLKHLFS